jgi:predicted nuclease with TOPRIM domain
MFIFSNFTASFIISSKGGEKMEQNTIVKEILKALDLHAAQLRTQMMEMNEQFKTKLQVMNDRFEAKLQEMNDRLETKMQEMNDRFEAKIERLENEMNERFNRLETKIDNLHTELTETQETVDFLSSKTIQHERKIRELYRQQ